MFRSAQLLSVVLLLGASAVLVGQPTPGGKARPYLGIAVGPNEDTGDGVTVREVAPNSPAAKAGFKEGDIVFKLDSKDVTDVAEFLRDIGSHKPGEKVSIQVQRDGKDQTITATLGERTGAGSGKGPVPIPPGLKGDPKDLIRPSAFLGVGVEPLTEERRKELGVKAEVGVVVTDVIKDSPAAKGFKE